MAAWTGDQKEIQQAYARREAARATMLASRREPESSVLRAASATGDAVQPTAQSSDASLPDSVPLPPGIAPGRYRVVSEAGETLEVSIGDTRDGQCDSLVTRDFYVTDDPTGNRWYLIRIADRMLD